MLWAPGTCLFEVYVDPDMQIMVTITKNISSPVKMTMTFIYSAISAYPCYYPYYIKYYDCHLDMFAHKYTIPEMLIQPHQTSFWSWIRVQKECRKNPTLEQL